MDLRDSAEPWFSPTLKRLSIANKPLSDKLPKRLCRLPRLRASESAPCLACRILRSFASRLRVYATASTFTRRIPTVAANQTINTPKKSRTVIVWRPGATALAVVPAVLALDDDDVLKRRPLPMLPALVFVHAAAVIHLFCNSASLPSTYQAPTDVTTDVCV